MEGKQNKIKKKKLKEIERIEEGKNWKKKGKQNMIADSKLKNIHKNTFMYLLTLEWKHKI